MLCRLFPLCLAGFVVVQPAAYAHGDLHDQIDTLTGEISRDATASSLYLRRAELHRMHRDWQRAFADYEKAQELKDAPPQLSFLYGRALLEAGKPEQAEEKLNSFLDDNPEHVEALRTRAQMYRAMGKPEAAGKDLEAAIMASTRAEPELYYERAEVLASSEGGLESALLALDAGLARLGPLISLQSYAVELEMRRGKPEAALSRLEAILTSVSRKERWLVRKAEIQLAAGQGEAAQVTISEASRALQALPRRQQGAEAVKSLRLQVEQLESALSDGEKRAF